MSSKYYACVQSHAEDLDKQRKAEAWSDEQVYDAVQEETAETEWSIYYGKAYECLTESTHEPEAWEELEDLGYQLERGNYRQVVCVVASIAYRLDVQDALSRLSEE